MSRPNRIKKVHQWYLDKYPSLRRLAQSDSKSPTQNEQGPAAVEKSSYIHKKPKKILKTDGDTPLAGAARRHGPKAPMAFFRKPIDSKRKVGSLAPVTSRPEAVSIRSLDGKVVERVKARLKSTMARLDSSRLGGKLTFAVIFDPHPEVNGAVRARVEVTQNGLTGLGAEEKLGITDALESIKVFSPPFQNPLDWNVRRIEDHLLVF